MTQPIGPFAYPSPIPKDALLAFIKNSSNVQCRWRDEGQKNTGLQGAGGVRAWIICSISRVRPYGGQDDYRQMGNPNNPNAILANLSGQRRVTVTLRAESEIPDILPPNELLERVRWGGMSFNNAILEAANIAYADNEDITLLPPQKQNGSSKLLSVAVTDIHFNFALNTRQQAQFPTAPGDSGNTIGTVDGGDQAPTSPSTITQTVTPR